MLGCVVIGALRMDRVVSTLAVRWALLRMCRRGRDNSCKEERGSDTAFVCREG